MQKNNNKKKITVAFFSKKEAGGVTSVDELVLGLDTNHFDLMFIYLNSLNADANLEEENERKVFYLSDKKQIRTFSLSCLFKLVRFLKEQKVDIIHCQTHKTTIYGTLAAIMAHTPVVLSHVHGLNRSRGLRRKLVNLLLFRRVNRIIPVADKVKDDVLRSNWLLPEDKLFVLENSVDYERFANVPAGRQEIRTELGLPLNAFVYGTIARFGPYKGHNFLIEAFKKVKGRLSSAHLLLVGEGPLKEQLKGNVAVTGLCQSIYFLGYRNDIPRLLGALDCFVLPSIGSEGMPRVILEAMATGVPCIATDVGGNSEIINSKDVGVLVRPNDSSALAEAMISIANMPEQEIINLVEKAKDRIHRLYSHDVVREKLENIYEAEVKHYYAGD